MVSLHGERMNFDLFSTKHRANLSSKNENHGDRAASEEEISGQDQGHDYEIVAMTDWNH